MLRIGRTASSELVRGGVASASVLHLLGDGVADSGLLRCQQLYWIDRECQCNAIDVVYGDIDLGSFDGTDKRSMQPCELAEFMLRVASGGSERRHVACDPLSRGVELSTSPHSATDCPVNVSKQPRRQAR